MEVINVGRFEIKVVLLKPESTRSATGEVQKTFVEDGYVFASVTHDTSESVHGEALVMSDEVKIVCHPWSGLKTSWRLMIDGEKYEILSVDKTDRRYTKMTARLMLE